MSGLGDPSQDKGTASIWTSGSELGQRVSDAVYMASSYMRNIIDIPPDTSVREGWEWCAPNDAGIDDFAEIMRGEENRLGLPKRLASADKAARLYGGGALVLGIEDGREIDQPVDEANINRVAWARKANRWELYAQTWDNDPTSPNFGNPLTYFWQPRFASEYQRNVHWSRVIRFDGEEVPDDARWSRQSWGGSILETSKPKVERLESVEQAIAAIIQEYQWATLKIKDLAELVSDDEGSRKLATRMAAMRMSRGIVKMQVVDADREDVRRDTASVAGLAELFDRSCRSVASAARMPISLIMGIGPGGLNSTGKDDAGEQWFYSSVRTMQSQRYRPAILQVGRYLQLAKSGPFGAVVEDADIEFAPLRVPTEGEAADVKLKTAQTNQIYIMSGVLDPGEVRESEFGGIRGDVTLEEPDAEEADDDANAITAESDAVLAAVAEMMRGMKAGEPDDDAMRADANDLDLRPTASMQEAAKRALAARGNAPASKRGMTSIGLATARDIAAGRALSPKRWERMLSFFQRFEPLRTKPGFERASKLGQAWEGWGGDDGFERAAKVVADLARMKADNRAGRADLVYARSRLSRLNGNLV